METTDPRLPANGYAAHPETPHTGLQKYSALMQISLAFSKLYANMPKK